MDYLFHLLEAALRFLAYLSWERFFAVFWPFLIFDCGRYLLADFLVLSRWIWKTGHEGEEAFALRLRTEQPLVSVIIPAYNEERVIAKTLQSVLEQSYPHLEIFVVDDGSTDQTGARVQALAAEEPRLTLFRNEQRVGKFSGQNLALNFTRGDYVFILDADSTLAREAFFEALKKFADPLVGAVSCNLRVRNQGDSLITSLQDLEYLASISLGRISQAWAGTLSIVSGGFGAFRRAVFEEVGGYDVHTGEDTDLTLKIRQAGWKITFAPRSLCLTEVPRTLWGLIKQRFRWDNCLINITIRKHRGMFNPFRANFTWKNLLGGLDNTLFQGVLNFVFVIYPIYIYLIFKEMTLVVLVSVYLVYLGFSFFQYFVGLAVSENRARDRKLLPFVPLFPLYHNFLLRVVRLLAHLGEILFRYTYRVPYIPPWVGRGADRW